MNSSEDVQPAERFYAASGSMATSVMKCDSRYYRECLMSDRGAVTVWLSSGDVERIAGTRCLDVERLRGEEIEGVLEVIYLGEVLRSYPAGTWTRWECAEGADPFTACCVRSAGYRGISRIVAALRLHGRTHDLRRTPRSHRQLARA